MVTGFLGWASQESQAEAILPFMTQLGSPQHNTQHDIHLSSFCWGSHQVLPWFKRKEMDLHPLMGSGKVLEQQCGARNTAVATFGNYHLLQLELKTFFTRKKKKGCVWKDGAETTNKSHLKAEYACSHFSPSGESAICAYCKLNRNKAF